jgi:uncharacterized membrane protein YhaH (DUF805 family)
MEQRTIESKPAPDIRKGLFSGRIGRRDFILFFFLCLGEAAVVLAIILGLFSSIFPQFSAFINDATSLRYHGVWLLYLPVILNPFTIILVSLITRRLHDISLPGGIAIGFFIFFVDPMNGITSVYGIITLQVMMGIIFIMLLTVKGTLKENKFGAPARTKTPFLERLFNQ